MNCILPVGRLPYHDRGTPLSSSVVETMPVADVITAFLRRFQRDLDILSVDAELMDEEILGIDIGSVAESPIARHLLQNGYLFWSRLWHSSIFIDRTVIYR